MLLKLKVKNPILKPQLVNPQPHPKVPAGQPKEAAGKEKVEFKIINVI